MKEGHKDYEHFLRAAVLFGLGLALFLTFRGFMVPKGFGAYGHFRPGALEDVRSRPVSYAGRAACEECHSDVVALRQGSKHERINCETCHGALAAHAQDPAAVTPVLPDPARLCLTCHAQNVARPGTFPQISPEEHAGTQACKDCHRPHHPEVE
jgi:hypothetical protein